ncbi:purine nucleoside permease [Xylariaceae sp. FL0662B]|nr:purine nucleoside permease [Xylariaceae sp. FL0662B]
MWLKAPMVKMLLFGYLAAISLIGSLATARWISPIAPKVLIVTFYNDECDIYLNNSSGNESLDFRAKQHRIPFGNPQFPYMHCTSDDAVCMVTVGEGIIQAAATTMALITDPMLDLRETYWVLTGIAGGAPDQVTLNSITLARFSVQVVMQHEIDAREMPANFSTGYFPQGAQSPEDDWGYVYNSEVYELNTNLREAAAKMIDPSQIVDTAEAQSYRANYAGDPKYQAAASPPKVVNCDVATSDTWWTGTLLAEAFAERIKTWTNGTGVYCTTAQEDGAVLGALLRGALENKIDYGRIIVIRTVSDFDRQYPNQTAIDNLLSGTAAYDSAVENVYVAGHSIAKGIIGSWQETYKSGIAAQNFLGDVWGTLGGKPDFGPGRESGGSDVDVPGAKKIPKRTSRRNLRHATKSP